MQQNIEQRDVTFLVIGGGIAGITCAETLAICQPNESILLLTESNVIKTIANLEPVARYLYKFDVKELSATNEYKDYMKSCIMIIVDQLIRIEASNKKVITKGKRIISYSFLCLCTGGIPRLIVNNNPRVLGIRDTDSVLELQCRLKNAKSIVLVGNGGIASELAYELHGVQVHWIIKDEHISSTFVDPGAAHFFLESHSKQSNKNTDTSSSGAVKRLRYTELVPQQLLDETKKQSAALGPDWHRNFELLGSLVNNKNTPLIYYKCHIKDISLPENDENDVKVILSTDKTILCDFVISATGVYPRIDFNCDEELQKSADGGILVNALMETNVSCIYAAGDICTANWELADHWFQMRLWTQARQMGAMAGRSMAAAFNKEVVYQDFCFEIFGHVTQLFGYQVVLLGRYNGQGLGSDYEILLRTTPGKEYIKFVLQNGRLRGAILIGDTDLAETCENLILNGIDLTPYGDDILNPDIDIEDYFD